jgi:hypothetical protein
MQSLVGLMFHAAQVVQPGRLMTRGILEQMRAKDRMDRLANRNRKYYLPNHVLDDIQWWYDCLDQWDSISFIPQTKQIKDEHIIIQSDAATSDGAGAVVLDLKNFDLSSISNSDINTANTNNNHRIDGWFHYSWPADAPIRSWRINELEMSAIAIALATLGSDGRLSGRIIHLHCDNSTCVTALSKERSRSPLLLRLLRGIFAIGIQFDFHIKLINHIRGTHNLVADSASRYSSQSPTRINELGLQSDRQMTPIIPPWLLSLMMQINY